MSYVSHLLSLLFSNKDSQDVRLDFTTLWQRLLTPTCHLNLDMLTREEDEKKAKPRGNMERARRETRDAKDGVKRHQKGLEGENDWKTGNERWLWRMKLRRRVEKEGRQEWKQDTWSDVTRQQHGDNTLTLSWAAYLKSVSQTDAFHLRNSLTLRAVFWQLRSLSYSLALETSLCDV